ncbi:MAG TPA: hypothetical protein ENI79_01960, partial [Rhodospirillales bacterium]|nr:hypothetical protein [Rhodospirillales bacterium]
MAKPPKKSLADWKETAAAELKGKRLDDLVWETPEGVSVKPLYTAEDLENLEHVESLPGLAPFLRGPWAT